APVEFVMLRTTGFGTFAEGAPTAATADTDVEPVVREVVFDGVPYRTPVYRRTALPSSFEGPAIVVEETATTVVPPDCLATVDSDGFLLLKLGGAR
ncbi:hydantoinase/oxoprolinase family protein, partial [Kibdelosporangium lantanae]